MLDQNQLNAKLEASPSPQRITPARIAEVIAKSECHRLTDTLTVCVITLQNGFTVTGESACADPANYHQEIGEKIAYENAKAKIWALEGYLLRERLSAA